MACFPPLSYWPTALSTGVSQQSPPVERSLEGPCPSQPQGPLCPGQERHTGFTYQVQFTGPGDQNELSFCLGWGWQDWEHVIHKLSNQRAFRRTQGAWPGPRYQWFVLIYSLMKFPQAPLESQGPSPLCALTTAPSCLLHVLSKCAAPAPRRKLQHP